MKKMYVEDMLLALSEPTSIHLAMPDDDVTEDDHTSGMIREGLIITDRFYNSCINAGIIFHGRAWTCWSKHDYILDNIDCCRGVTLPARHVGRKRLITSILDACVKPVNESNFHKFDSFTPKELRNVWRAFC